MTRPIAWKDLSQLQRYLESRIPGGRLELMPLPLVPEIALHLINADYPRDGLNPEQVQALMDNPPYWAFCWASGQVLARFLLDNPEYVRGRQVVDFGAGSGVVGIAAKLAGADRVILCDSDALALSASQANARRIGTDLCFSSSLQAILEQDQRKNVVTVADVFYDRENLPLLKLLVDNFATVLVADSRLKGRPLDGMAILGYRESHTVPDLDESAEFNHVTLYQNLSSTPAPPK